MDQLIDQVFATLRSMWRRRWYGVLGAWVVALVGGVIVTRIPDRFEAEARVYVDTKSVLRPLMRELTVEPDLDQTIGMLSRTLITRPNLELLIKKAELLPVTATQADRDGMVETLLRSIKVTALSRDNVFGFGYRDSVFKRQLAGKVERAPEVWQRLGLEWLYRVKQEPRRLWRRYLVRNTVFCGMVFGQWLRRLWPAR